MNKQIRWGILGTALIAREQVIPGMRKTPYSRHARVTAIASRSLPQAEAVARELSIDKAYGSYEELLADNQIDAVYIPLPNHLHVPFSIDALESGKHVLCEKPIALSAAEAETLVAAATQYPRLKLMEAFMYRHHPQWLWARQMVDEERIGPLRTIQTIFSYFDENPDRILHNPAWGGGALMDIGCYPISLSRFLFRAEPTRVVGTLEHDPRFGVDRLTSGLLEFEAGTSIFTCATQLVPHQRVNIYGTRGRIEIEIPFNAPTDRPCRAWLDVDGTIEELHFETCDQYGIQADLFSRAILEDLPVPTPISDAVANMRVIDALVKSGQRNNWEGL